MTSYILDTDVVSTLAPGRPAKPPPDPALAAWVLRNEDRLFFSSVTVMEVERGILGLGRRPPERWHAQLGQWFGVFLERFTHHVLAVDLQVARAAAAIADRHAARGIDPGAADTMIAATAVVHGMSLLTRNIRHFAFTGAEVIDPFKTLPP